MGFSKTTKNIRFKTDGIVNMFNGYRDKWDFKYFSILGYIRILLEIDESMDKVLRVIEFIGE